MKKHTTSLNFDNTQEDKIYLHHNKSIVRVGISMSSHTLMQSFGGYVDGKWDLRYRQDPHIKTPEQLKKLLEFNRAHWVEVDKKSAIQAINNNNLTLIQIL